MIDRDAARGYADALLVLAQSRREINEVENGLRIIGQLLRQNRDFRAIIRDHELSPQQRMDRLKPVFGEGISALVVSHIHLLLQHRHENLLTEMIEQYIESVSASRETITAEVYTVVPLDDTRIKRLEQMLSKRVRQPVLVHNMINETLLGGVFIKIGSEIIDHSIRSRLRNMRTSMTRVVSIPGASAGE